jgi:hypothetical protein
LVPFFQRFLGSFASSTLSSLGLFKSSIENFKTEKQKENHQHKSMLSLKEELNRLRTLK